VIDHLVYATVHLARTVDELNSRFGIKLTPGGQHVGLGTRNFLADLGDTWRSSVPIRTSRHPADHGHSVSTTLPSHGSSPGLPESMIWTRPYAGPGPRGTTLARSSRCRASVAIVFRCSGG